MLRTLFYIALVATLTGCSPFYVMRAAYEESKILLNREKITDVLEDQGRDPEQQRKLKLVLEARQFAKEIGLKPGKSYTRFTNVDRDVLSWIVMGSKPDSFELYTWWFPIVGSVPYKGYFELDDAKAAAKRLEDKGYEVWVRGTDAFSTLGWFNDPILSTTLKRSDPEIVNTVIHETFHRTVWIKGSAAINETAANFVGCQGAIEFYQARGDSRQTDTTKLILAQQLELSQMIGDLYAALRKLYDSDLSREEKIAKREVVFKKHTTKLRKKYPKIKILSKINNAEIMQLYLYLKGLDRFQELYEEAGSDWQKFIEKVRKLSAKDLE